MKGDLVADVIKSKPFMFGETRLRKHGHIYE